MSQEQAPIFVVSEFESEGHLLEKVESDGSI